MHEAGLIGRAAATSLAATRTGPLSEAMPACRGRRADHAQKDRIGTWEIPVRPEQFRFWSASGRENRKPMMNERGKSTQQ